MKLLVPCLVVFIFNLPFSACGAKRTLAPPICPLTVRCDYKYTEVGYIKYHHTPAIFKDARLRCMHEGAALVVPLNDKLKRFIYKSMCYTRMYTGLHGIFSQGGFRTLDGIPIEHTAQVWERYEPNNKENKENCVTFNTRTYLSDDKCDVPRPYMCWFNVTSTGNAICGTLDKEYRFDADTSKCYKFHVVPRRFDRAHFVCSAEGGHLVIINSEKEAGVVRKLFNSYTPSKILGHFNKNIAFAGFHNWFEGGDWRTIHGQTLEDAGYAKFAKGQPDNATEGEYCGSVFRDGTLNDVWCNREFLYICEKDPAYPPTCNTTERNTFYNSYCNDG